MLAFEKAFHLAPPPAPPQTAFDLASQPTAPKTVFDLAAARRQRTLWRLDGGFGTDPNLTWLLARGYQVLAKGFSGRRAEHLAEQVQRWNPHQDAWLGAVEAPRDWGSPVKVWVKRRRDKEALHYSYYVTTLKLHSLQAEMERYDNRGGAEVEQFREDKQGLHLSARRKHRLLAQKALILLTDMAHNLLADFRQGALTGTPFAEYGAKRIVRDLFQVEGYLGWEGDQLQRIELNADYPQVQAIVEGLLRYIQSGKKTS